MYLQGQEAEFRSFLAQNTAFWRENTGCPRDAHSILYVDLAHDSPAYLLTNLWIAKYIQRLRGGRLVGLALGWTKACPHYRFERVRELAQSFLVDEVIDLDSTADDDPAAARRFAEHVKGFSGGDLRKAILAFDADTDPDVGWIIYDTWLRQERRGTIEDCDAELLRCAHSVIRTRTAIANVIRQSTAIGAVVGHYHYSPYSFMALETARQGAPVYFQSLLLPVSIRRFATLADVRRGRPSDFLRAYEEEFSTRVSTERLNRWSRRMFDIQGGTREFFRVIPGSGALQSRSDFLTARGLNPAKPVVCLYAPALCGAPHCFGPIPFDDFGDWLLQSLRIAAETPDVNFLVKPHPQDSVYDTSGLLVHLASSYSGVQNIRFLTADIASDQMMQICDLVATVSGTPGYEMAVREVPTVAAGPSRYSGLGFAEEPASLCEYRNVLTHPRHQKLSDESQKRAALFAFFELTAGKSQSLFVPRLRAAADFWKQAELNVRSRYCEEDPLFRNLRNMLERDLPFLLNTDLVPPQTPSAVAAPHDSAGSAMADLHALALATARAADDRAVAAERKYRHVAEESVRVLELAATVIRTGAAVEFRHGQPSSHMLGNGWSVPEAAGVWTDGHAAEIDLPWVDGEAVLCLECTAFTPRHSPVRLVELWCNDVKLDSHEFHPDTPPYTWRVPIGARGPSVKIVLRIPEPAIPTPGERRLGLWLSRLRIEPA
jgi:hypothetical protein